jgi:uncharacterized membrane protein YfcA
MTVFSLPSPILAVHHSFNLKLMLTTTEWILIAGGLASGLLAGLLGIGGGTLLVPILIALHYSYPQSVATSILAIVMTSVSGSLQNWRMGYLKLDQVILLGLPGTFTALVGAHLASELPRYSLEAAFGVLLLLNIYLTNLRQKLADRSETHHSTKISPFIACLLTGGAAGFLAGLFGVGGGVILVPLQMLFLGEKIKVAIQTSLGAIVITSVAAFIGHWHEGNVLFLPGVILGIGGLLGVQASTRYLPKLSDRTVKICFIALLFVLSIYFFWRAWISFLG